MATLYPYIFSTNARNQADFYIQALGGELESIQTYDEMPDTDPELEGRVMHLVLNVAGVKIFMADAASDDVQSGNNIDLTLEFPSTEEAKKAFEGLSLDGEIYMPFEKMFWGDHFGRLKDQFGVRWQIASKE